MSASIYYTARRKEPLTEQEQIDIQNLITKYSVNKEIDEYDRTGKGHNWESFCVYDKDDLTESEVIFQGSTKLPDDSEEGMWEGLQHWNLLLSSIRNIMPNAEWDVHVDDHDLVWDDECLEYDLYL